MIDHFADRVNQLDDQLGHRIASGSLAAEEEGAWCDLHLRVSLQAKIEGENIKHIQMLTLVFVDSFDLGIEHGAGIYREAGVLEDVLSESHFDVTLHLPPLSAEGGILSAGLQLLEVLQVADPAIPDLAGHQLRLFGIAHGQPTPRCHPVGHVDEFIGPQIVEVTEQVVLQQLRVQFGDAIDVLASHACKVGHSDELRSRLVDDGHANHSRVIAGESLAYRIQEAAVYLVNDLDVAGKQCREQG